MIPAAGLTASSLRSCYRMRWWLVGVGLWLTVVLVVPDVQAGGRPPNPQGEEGHRAKRKRDGKGRTREGRSRPLKIRLVPGPNIPEKPAANQGSSGFLNVYLSTKDQQSSYSVIPVPNDPSEAVVPLTQEEIQKILWREEVEHREEEERLRKKDEARRKRRKERKEQEEIQRKIVERKRRKEEEALRLQAEKEEEWRKQIEEAEERRRQEEQIRREEEERKNKEKEALEKERKLKEERRKREEIQRKEAEERQSEAEEKEVWLRGDVFQMTPKEPDLLPVPIPIPPAATEETEETELGEENLMTRRSGGAGLPQGCDLSDVTLTCENAQLRYFPPLSISELKSLSLEGNNITNIPAGAFNGIPNLEWINLKKNKLTSAGIDANTFKGLKMLRRLYLDENLLDTMPPNLPPTLQELKINENKLRRINENSFQDLSSLVILELEGNMLSEGNVDPKAFTPLKELSYLRLGRNHFRMVPQGLPRSLLELYLENNLIEEISETAFNQTSNLNVVSLRHNKLDETMIAPMAWFNHRNLESIDLSHNKLYLVPSFLPKSLVHLVLVGNRIERIPGFVFAHMDPGLEYLYLSFNKLDGEGVEPESFYGVYHTMTEMCLDHNQLIHVPVGISEMTNLHFLRLDNNQIRSISDESICDPNHSEEATLVGVRIENNYIDPQKVSPTAFSCVRSASSVVLKPQKIK